MPANGMLTESDTPIKTNIHSLSQNIQLCTYPSHTYPPPATPITIKSILPFTPNLSHILTNLFAYTLDHIFLIQYILYTPNIPCHFPFSHTPSEHLVVYAQHMGR